MEILSCTTLLKCYLMSLGWCGFCPKIPEVRTFPAWRPEYDGLKQRFPRAGCTVVTKGIGLWLKRSRITPCTVLEVCSIKKEKLYLIVLHTFTILLQPDSNHGRGPCSRKTKCRSSGIISISTSEIKNWTRRTEVSIPTLSWNFYTLR